MNEISLDVLVNRFKDYISFNTQSDEASKTCPSTPGQMVLAKHIAQELEKIGLTEVSVDKNGYVMATLPANGVENVPTVGFISHMDTSMDMAGGPLNPRIVKAYDGGDIVLNEKENIILSPQDFPELKNYVGQDIMVADGLTLLGADDKAGICAIVSAMEYLLQNPQIKHGKVRIGFTPDEEVGRGADKFDVAAFGADFAYTIDGGALGGIEYENFNACNISIKINGCSVHTGYAKNKMINALTVAAEINQMLPAGERPEFTEGYEGFYHIHAIEGSVESAEMTMLIRDHDRANFEKRKALLTSIAAFLNAKYGENTVVVDMKDCYYNMREKIDPVMYVVDIAKEAMCSIGVTPVEEPIRGGTDGARLSFEGLPCPNIFTGGLNFHGKFEYLPLLSLQKAAMTVVGIIDGVSKRTK